MTKIANIRDHERFEAAEAPPRAKGAQVEEGYTRIAHPILDALCCADFTAREFRVVHFVIRTTYGWNTKACRMSGDFIAKKVKLDPSRCSKVLNELIRRRVLIRHGGSRSPVSLNKHTDEWMPRVGSKRQAPTRKADLAHSEPTQSAQDGPTNKDRKDINTSPIGEESTAGADDANQVDQNHRAEPQPDQGDTPAAKTPSLPNCPHHEILDLWAEIMPDKRQPNRSLWPGSAKARHLAARWKAGFTIINEQTGEPLYRDTASGLDWWGRFFRFLRKSEFLMRDDSRWFGLDWVANRENFRKILELAYHGGES